MKQIKKIYARDGYIMIFTLLVVAAATVVVTYVGHRGSFYIPFSHMILAREKAKMIALGGVQVAIAQLAKAVKAEEAKEQKKEEKPQEGAPAEKKNPTRKREIFYDVYCQCLIGGKFLS